MTGTLLHVGAVLMCAHAGQVQFAPGAPRVRLSGQPAATMADLATVVGCPLNVSGAPQPCLTVQWVVPASRVRIGGSPALLSTSTGLGLGPTQAPQGPVSFTSGQVRVSGQ